MALEQRIIVRCSKAAFWLALAAIVCGIVSFATLNVDLLQLYLLLALMTLFGLVVLRWRAGQPLKTNWATWATVLPCTFLGLSVFLIPLCTLIHVSELRTKSRNSIKTIAGGILAYQAKQGHLPAATMNSPSGEPLFSWRVAILPFLGEEELYRQFRLDEPWDSLNNLPLLKRMPAVYHTRLQPGERAPPHTTFYQVFAGPGTAFEPGAKLQIPRDFPDGEKNTILLIEAGIAVPWTKPEDLVYDPKGPIPSLSAFRHDKGRFPFTGGEGTGCVILALCDGSVRSASWPGVPEEILRNLIVRNDRGYIPADW